jgi:hypothetical protein
MQRSWIWILAIAFVADCGARTGLEDPLRPTTARPPTTSTVTTGEQTGGTLPTGTGGTAGAAGTAGLGTGGTSQQGVGGVTSTRPGQSAEWCREHAGSDGGGGAHTYAYGACCQCGWPVDGDACQYLLKALPFCDGPDDYVYYSCIGGEVPICVLDHLDSCAYGFPAECEDAYAAQMECLRRVSPARGG